MYIRETQLTPPAGILNSDWAGINPTLDSNEVVLVKQKYIDTIIRNSLEFEIKTKMRTDGITVNTKLHFPSIELFDELMTEFNSFCIEHIGTTIRDIYQNHGFKMMVIYEDII